MFSKEVVDAVVQELEKFASESQLSELENLAKIAVYQDGINQKRAAKATGSHRQDLYKSLAASVGLAK